MSRQLLKSILTYSLVWMFALAFWIIMRIFGQDVVLAEEFSFSEYFRGIILMGLAAGVLFGSLAHFFERFLLPRTSFGKGIVLGSAMYSIAVFFLLSFGMRVITFFTGVELNWSTYRLFIHDEQLLLFFVYSFMVGFGVSFVSQIDKKFGPGNLWRMLKGEFHHPKEDVKIFMFLDLRSSTLYAEQLGHIRYSKMIQDCFKDLVVVEKYHAEVYQYVGDEAVLTWSMPKGVDNLNCIKAYFDFQQRIMDRSQYYEKKYGIVPEFKAGMNLGTIVIAEVGEIKREIAFHGDTINTASRIQDQCNRLGKDLLISEVLKDSLSLENHFATEHVGDLLLKGKKHSVNIYSVERT